MKKLLLLLIIIFHCFFSHAQNYQCLQAGVKHYFINGNGYLRGIRIDSVRTYADSTVYFPFRTPRGPYYPSSTSVVGVGLGLDRNGGSWLGKKVLQLNDGTFIFDSYWNDSVIIKTQANVGDNWVFYSDSSSLYYKATLVSIDTMTVLSLLDTVKKIMINAWNSSGHVSSDPVDSFSIILGKNSGFVQVFDLYTFPFHKPDSTYRIGLDFCLDRSTLDAGNINLTGGVAPNQNITLFKLIDFVIPNALQLYDWNVGDIIQSYHRYSNWPLRTYGCDLLDTVNSKVVSGLDIIDSIIGTYCSCTYPYPCSLICRPGVVALYNNSYPIVPQSYIPEQDFDRGDYLFYYPYDTNYCLLAPAYSLIRKTFPRGALGTDPWITKNFKLGIGQTYYEYINVSALMWEWDGLIYTNIHGVGCGTPRALTTIDSTEATTNILGSSVWYYTFPNPATNLLTIKTTNTLPYTITLQNMLGQTVQTHYSNKQKQTLNISDVPVGVYNISITDESGNRYNEKVVIMH